MSPRSTSAFQASSDSCADPGQADHGLQLGAVALLQGGEAELPGIAREHDPAGDADVSAGLGVGGQVRIGGADLGQRVGARHRDRVGILPVCQQPFPLGLPDPELLGNVGVGASAELTTCQLK